MLNYLSYLLLVPALLLPNELKKVVKKDKEANTIETFYVLKSNPAIKEGPYERMYNKSLSAKGFYRNNLKDSVWTEYIGSGSLAAKGRYSKNEKAGIWEYFGFNEELVQKYDHSKHELLYTKQKESGKGLDFKFLSQPTAIDKIVAPVYLGDDFAIIKHLQYNITYPAVSRDNDIQGKIIVTFTVDEHGTASNHHVTKSVSEDLDKEALRVVKLLPDNWVPATINGKSAATEVSLPVVFKLM